MAFIQQITPNINSQLSGKVVEISKNINGFKVTQIWKQISPDRFDMIIEKIIDDFTYIAQDLEFGNIHAESGKSRRGVGVNQKVYITGEKAKDLLTLPIPERIKQIFSGKFPREISLTTVENYRKINETKQTVSYNIGRNEKFTISGDKVISASFPGFVYNEGRLEKGNLFNSTFSELSEKSQNIVRKIFKQEIENLK